MDALTKAVMDQTFEQDGKTCLACGSAYQVAGKMDVPISAIADICEAEQIKIRKCQLKCFD